MKSIIYILYLLYFLDPAVTWVCALRPFAIRKYFAVFFSCCLSLYSVLWIVGFCGRRLSLKSIRAGHSNRKCWTSSLIWLHRLQFGRCSLRILLRCAFKGVCVVRSLKMDTCSFLGKEFIGSFLFGAVTKLNIALPFLLCAHLLCQSIFEFDLMTCLMVAWDTDKIGCSFAAPSFASVSALSFPSILQWLGIHCTVTVLLVVSINSSIANSRSKTRVYLQLWFFLLRLRQI